VRMSESGWGDAYNTQTTAGLTLSSPGNDDAAIAAEDGCTG
jgi:hypothetical protein